MISPKLKAQLLGATVAAAAALGATAASAITFGTLPGGGTGTNEGLAPVYGVATTNGWYGATLFLVGGSADITVEYIGAEAGFENEFAFGGTTLFTTPGVSGWNTTGAGTTVISGVGPGKLDFSFLIDGGPSSVDNGSNPDGSPLKSPPNFFVTFRPDGDENGTSGLTVDIWLDDGGGSRDDNHDDMLIRLSVGNGNLSVVPVPASIPLLLTALGGLGLAARRKRSA